MVYQTRSFNKAAEILFISQSTVSTQIKKLENKLGQPLFVRHKREQVRPTSEGDRLYPQALEIVTKWNDIKNAFTNQLGAKVQIVASHSAAHLIIPDIMPLIDNDQSNISIAVSNSNDILRAILDEKAQIGFVEKTPESRKHCSTTHFQWWIGSGRWLFQQDALHSRIRFRCALL